MLCLLPCPRRLPRLGAAVPCFRVDELVEGCSASGNRMLTIKNTCARMLTINQYILIDRMLTVKNTCALSHEKGMLSCLRESGPSVKDLHDIFRRL